MRKKGRKWSTEGETLQHFRGFCLDWIVLAFFSFPIIGFPLFLLSTSPPTRERSNEVYISFPVWAADSPPNQYGSPSLLFYLFILENGSWKLGEDKGRSSIPSSSWVSHSLENSLLGKHGQRQKKQPAYRQSFRDNQRETRQELPAETVWGTGVEIACLWRTLNISELGDEPRGKLDVLPPSSPSAWEWKGAGSLQ